MGGISSGQPGEASARSSIVTLINSCVGVGVLSLPYAFRAAGWAGGLALLAFVAFTEAFTLYVLSRYAEHTDATTYSTVVRDCLGGPPIPWEVCVFVGGKPAGGSRAM